MRKKYLLGFYRKRKRVWPVYSGSPYFRDVQMGLDMEAVIVPLALLKSDFPWQKADFASALPKIVLDIIDNNFVFATTPKEESHFFLLMLRLRKIPSMSRTGVLLYKKGDSYQPIKVKIKGYEYLVELKGCGCPLGGFPKFHLRNQAGANVKGHLRITGGLSIEGAKKEFCNLERMRQITDPSVEKNQLKAAGYAPFYLVGPNFKFDLGILMRLTPSSIRYSFSKNPDIERMFDQKELVFFENAGLETAKFLFLKEPSIHRNISWNNMVFINKKTVVLSDYEELTEAANGHCNLDYPDYVYPYHFLEFREKYKIDVYQKGLKNILKGKKYTSIDELNEDIFRNKISLAVFRKRIKSGMALDFLQDNIYASRQFVGPEYFKLELKKWLADRLVPKFENQIKILKKFKKYFQENSINILNECINNRCKVKSRVIEFSKLIERVDKDILKFMKNGKLSQYGKYISRVGFEWYFLRSFDNERDLQKRLNSLEKIINNISQFIRNEKLELAENYVMHSYQDHNALMFSDTAIYIYPFLGWLNIWFYNERRILEGVNDQRQKLTSKEKGVLDRSLEELKCKQEKLGKNPDFFYRLFVGDRLVSYLVT